MSLALIEQSPMNYVSCTRYYAVVDAAQGRRRPCLFGNDLAGFRLKAFSVNIDVVTVLG